MNLLQEGQNTKKSEFWKILLGCVLFTMVFLADTKMIHADVWWYVDAWSLLVPTCIFVAIILTSGARRKDEILGLIQKTSIPIGLMVSLISAISICGQFTEPEYIGKNLSVAMLSLLYSAVVYVIVCVWQQRIHR